MDYGFVSRDDMRGQRYSIRKGQYIAGHAIGIIHLQVWYPLIPGNVVNATTYRYPVRLKELQGGTQDKIHRGDPSVFFSPWQNVILRHELPSIRLHACAHRRINIGGANFFFQPG